MDKDELWQAALVKIELTLSRPSFLTWFQETGISHIEGNIATVFVPNGFAKEWLQNKYHKTILHAIREVSSDVREVSYIIGKRDIAHSYGARSDQGKRRHGSAAGPFVDDTPSFKELAVNPETN